MSDIKFSCPGCGQHITCDESLGGNEVQCPGCKAVMVVPGGAPAPAAAACPGCAAPLAEGAVICTQCGLNLQTGQKLGMEAGSRHNPVPAVPARGGGATASRSPADDRVPIPVWIWAIAGVFLLLFVAGWLTEGGAVAFQGITGLFALVIGIWVLVDAFQDSASQGVLTLCVPFYVIYRVYWECENPLLKMLFTIGLTARIAGFLLLFRWAAGGA